MQVGFAETHALIGLVRSDDFLDAMNQQSVANRPALMRTDVEESVQLALGANDADLPSFMFNHIAGAFRHISGTRYENFGHYQSLNSCRRELYDPCPAAQLTILARIMSRIEGPQTSGRQSSRAAVFGLDAGGLNHRSPLHEFGSRQIS